MTNFDLLVRSISKHVDITADEQAYLISLFSSQSLKTREYLIREGDICRFEYFVDTGCLRSFYLDRFGKDHTMMFALKGWWTGNLNSFLTSSPSKYCVQALEDTTVLKIGKNSKEQMFRQIPQMERFFRSILENALIAQQNRMIDFLSLSAKERYSIFNDKFPGLEQKVSQKNIASYLGITPAFLCRIRGKKNK